jgi:DNA-binding PadR family transcriptional regulator
VSTPVNLTPTSVIVLGLLDFIGGRGTPYDLKQAVGLTVGNFWTFQHAQLYTETERLAKAGLLDEEREEGGRRRKHYSLTAKGRKALEDWLREPANDAPELRNLGVLKVFMGADPKTVAAAQAEAHERELQKYRELRELDTGEGPRGAWIALDFGIDYQKQMIRLWRRLADSAA